ncbi:MAG: hypothetical protein EOO75_17475, partial [Myxococcales bacterium]
LLGRLTEDDSSLVRRAVAANAVATEPMLERLVSDGSAQVRQAVGRNPRVPRWMLRKLARDPSEYVNDRARRKLQRTGSGWLMTPFCRPGVARGGERGPMLPPDQGGDGPRWDIQCPSKVDAGSVP